MTAARAGCVGESRGGGIGTIVADSDGVVGEEDREEERELEGELGEFGEEKGNPAVIGVVALRSPFSEGMRSMP